MIELNDEQRQALIDNAEAARVLDPSTKDEYVLIRADVYARMRQRLDAASGADSLSPSLEIGQDETDVRPLRQSVRDLPLPPDIAQAAQAYCGRHGLWRQEDRRQVEEEMKLRHYYGGKWIALLRTEHGPVVVAAADSLSDPAFDQQLSFLTGEERRSRLLERAIRLSDDDSEILALTSHES